MIPCDSHVLLHVIDARRPDSKQAVPVRTRADGLLELGCSPGFVEGVAAGDVVRLVDAETGRFVVVSRGGNLAIKVFGTTGIAPAKAWLQPRLEALGGWWDGELERAVVFTVPCAAGFPAVEKVLDAAAAEFPGLSWFFGNVYDDEGKPLNWWL